MDEKPVGKIKMTIVKEFDAYLSNYDGAVTLGDCVAFEQKEYDKGENDPIEYLDDNQTPIEVKFEAGGFPSDDSTGAVEDGVIEFGAMEDGFS